MQCFITFPNTKKRIENTKHSISKYFYDIRGVRKSDEIGTHSSVSQFKVSLERICQILLEKDIKIIYRIVAIILLIAYVQVIELVA